MNCEDCNNEAEVHYCLECDVLRNNRIIRTPVELVAEDLFNALEKAGEQWQGHNLNSTATQIERSQFISRITKWWNYIALPVIEKAKILNSPSPLKNPTGPDEYKSSL